MLVSRDEAQARHSHNAMMLPPRLRRRTKPDTHRSRRKALFWPAMLPLILMGALLGNWAFLTGMVFAAPATAASKPGHLTLQQAQQEGQPNKQNKGTFQRPTTHPVLQNAEAEANKQKQNQPLPGAEPVKMKDQTFTLDDSFVLHRPRMASSTKAAKVTGTVIPAGSTPFQIKGSDGRLEVDLARGSLDFSQATLADGSAPVGQLFLQLHQVAGHYIEEESLLGAYQLQIVDSQGNLVQGVKLLQPLTIVYHYQPWEMQDLNIDPTQVHLSWIGMAAPVSPTPTPTPTPGVTPTATPSPTPASSPTPTPGVSPTATQTPGGLVAPMVSTMNTQATSTPSVTVVPMTNDASTQTLTAQTMQINGTLAATAPPDIAAPGHPDIFETNSNSGQYSYSYPISVAPGPDGFAPQLQLSYSSQATNGRYSRTAPAGDEGDGWSLSLGSITAAQYPSSSTGGAQTWYSINGVDGISDKLVPDPVNQTTFYSTQHISHLRIQWTGSCWTIWDRDGTYYQLGCTADSLQKSASGPYEWDVNEVLAPYNTPSQVKAMLISYLQDSPSSGVIRDSGIKQIKYGFATSAPASSLSQVVGTVDFSYLAPKAQSPWASAYSSGYYSSCNPYKSTTLRCDDPLDDPNGMSASPVRSTLSLQSITSYVGKDDGTGYLANSYAFAYADSTFWVCHDPLTQIETYCAGEHLLQSITPTTYVQGTSYQLKPVTFGYTAQVKDTYYDPNQKNLAGTGQYAGQNDWHYLNHYQDLQTGEGANISYATAYANMAGTPYQTDDDGDVTDDRFDPFYCDLYTDCTGVYAHPDTDSWSVQTVTQVSALGTDSSGNTTVATTTYAYDLTPMASTRSPVNCHPITGTNVPEAEAECMGDSWVAGYDGTPTPKPDKDWADFYHSEFRGFSVVYIHSPSNNLTVNYYFGTDGWWTPTSNGTNYNTGQLFQQDVYQGPNEVESAILKETLNYFTGVGNTPDEGNTYHNNSCNGNLSPIYTPCIAAALKTLVYFYDGNAGTANEPNVPWLDTTYTYDDMNADGGFNYSGGYHNLTQEVISGTNLLSSVYPLTKKWQYTITNGKGTNGIFYYDVDKVTHSEIDDATGHVWACQDTTYDEGAPTGLSTPTAGWATTQTSYSTCGTASTALTSYTAYDQYGNAVATVDPLATANPGLYSSHGCSASGVVNLSATWTAGHFTSCTTYDSYGAQLLTRTNALGQATNATYDYTSGAQPSTTMDANGQVTGYSYAYDSNGDETINLTAPGGTWYTSRQSEHSTCTSSSALPCYEIDTNSGLYSSAVSRTFYDSQGRAVETRTPGPTPGDDTVVMTVYNDQNDSVWKSEPFQVVSGSGWIDPTGAKDVNGNVPAGTMTFSDALGRTLATQDPNWHSAQEPGLACSTVLTGTYTTCTTYTYGQALGDPDDYFSLATSVDANGHVSQSFTDGLGNVVFTQQDSGVYGGTLTPLKQTQTRYNALNKPTSVIVTDEQPQSGESPASVTTTMTYDDQGRALTETDPDQGTFTTTYDPDGHTLSVVQTAGSNSRTIGFNYDLLGRVGCEQTAAPTINWNGACSAGNPLVQNTYDTTFLGTQGASDFPLGHLTQSVATTYYPDSTSATVTQQMQTDQRGQTTKTQMQFGLPSGWGVTTSLPTYHLAVSYNDANQITATTATAGTASYSFSPVYDATTGSLQGLSTGTSGGTANLASLAYNEYAQLSGITLLNGSSTQIASTQYSYDGDQRPTGLTTNWLPGSGTSGEILGQTRAYDNGGNVTSTNTFFASVPGHSGSGGSEVQNFCYDEQNRLIWSGNGGTQP
ncbi:MAG TPA: SpvB/TcaC N-terminal domain-containing protein, partial [Ktedonobacteraceae bacterium]|nr:SpvB/TcaC N-terminal domain-containing protein [Ktedonobacteraceae bacterium]